MPWEFDLLIVGAGYSGLVFAERASTQLGLRCLVVDRRRHIGGNSYDCYDEEGVLIHPYGPHYFRTNSPKIVEYLSQFTKWRPVEYKILSYTEGRFWNFPINLNTFEQLIGRPSTTEEMERWLAERRVPIECPKNSEEVILSQVGRELYEKFFEGYTLKQWRRHPRELDPSVCGRIPIRTNRDDRYLREDFQALPAAGYTKMFEAMLEACGERVQLLLGTDFRDVLPHVRFLYLVYTGPIDEFFDCRFGRLPYRSLRFERKNFTPEQLRERLPVSRKVGFWQPAMQVNYPSLEVAWTRIVEIKHATGQLCANSTIVYEFPDDFGPGKEPYYPVPAPDSSALYQRYKEIADLAEREPEKYGKLPPSCGCKGISFIGRLATYRYYNMDQVVAMALREFEKFDKLWESLRHSSCPEKVRNGY
ncbi:MAG: NAD(P)-binding protein [Chthoniobacterales bacterium]|nr:NAD(P)-binding protein [Chthoniobacterales bacterium]